MSTEVENSAAADARGAAHPPAGSAPNSAPTSPATAASKTPFKKEKKKVPEKTDEYLLARFQGDGVRYKAKLIGVDDVPEARGDKMSQDSMMKLKGMAIAARSQGKHKQRIWVNISMSGIKIIDEKSGVIEHEHIVNKISFIARDVTDNRAFGYVCGAEGQHQFFAIKTGQQAEPLVIDLKDLFQVIFNQRKKEAEASHKGENSSTVVENGSDALLSLDAQKTAKPMEQLDLFGDMSTPPDIHSPTESNDILLLDLSSEVDSNQNCIKGNPFVTSCASNLWASPHTENPFSSAFGFFPTPDTDPFKDDPLSNSPTQSASHNNPHISLTATNHSLETTVPAITKTIMNGALSAGDSSELSELSNETVILALSNGHWPLGGMISQGPKSAMEEESCVGPVVLSTQNPFLDVSAKSVALSNGVPCDPQGPVPRGKESGVVISPPPQNAKAGRGRRRAQRRAVDSSETRLPVTSSSTNNDLFGADLFAAPGQTDGSSDAVDGLFNNTPASSMASSISALGNLQLGPTATSAGLWGTPTTVHSMFPSMPGVGSPGTLPGPPQPAFPQPSAFGGLPIPPGIWGQQQMPQPQYGAPPPQHWGQPPPQVGPMGAAPGGWGQPPVMVNPFQPSHFPMMGGELHQGPPRPPPRPPAKEAPPKVENSAFTALDPLGEKEKKMGKDMFKDFQIAKPPPAIPARKGESPGGASTNGGGGAFDQYFSNKVGVPQDAADHDDFDISQSMSVVVNDAPAAVLAPSLNPGLLDAAFSPAPAAAPAPAPSQGFNQNIFDEAFGAPPTAMSPPAIQTSGSSDPFGDPFGNPFA